MSSARPVRIPRRGGVSTPPPVPAAAPSGVTPDPVAWRPNGAGTQRALRLTFVYLVVVVALYIGFVAAQRGSPGGTSAGAASGLYAFTVVAGLIGTGGALFAMTLAPRGIEVRPTGTVIVGRWGRREGFPPIGRLETRTVREYPAGLLSREPVAAVELTRKDGVRRTVFLEKGLLATPEAVGSD